MTSFAAQPSINNATLAAEMPARCRELLAREPFLQAHCLEAPHYNAVRACESSIASAEMAARCYRDRLCFGQRRAGGEPAFEALTYGEFWRRVQALATGLSVRGLARPGQFVGVCGAPSIDWVVADFACLYLSLVSVPIPTTMTAEELHHVIGQLDLACCVCSRDMLAPLASVWDENRAARGLFIVMGHEANDALSVSTRARVETMADVERTGAAHAPVCPVAVESDETIRTLLYTSGSSGSPKAAVFPERIWKLHWQGGFFSKQPTDLPYITLAYMPLSHAMGRAQVINSFIRGGLTHFTLRADMSTLLEDIGLVRPTLIAVVPRVGAMIRDYVDEDPSSARVSIMGDRLLLISTGSALMPADLLCFLQERFQVPVLDGYGSTEAGLLSFEGKINHESVLAFKLADRPDLGYLNADCPYPRGELLVKTKYAVAGYFRDEAASSALFDDEGFLRTGDIVEQRGDDGVLVIDRARNIVKLSNGEFVNISRLEDLYASGGRLIRQIYLHGAADCAYLIAVIVVDTSLASQERGDGTLLALLNAELHRIADAAGCKSFEVPRAIVISHQSFTKENGLLTETLKPARAKLKAQFNDPLRVLADPGHHQAFALDKLAQAVDPAQKLAVLLGLVLGSPHMAPFWAERSFVHLGGDSLCATRLSQLCEQHVGVRVPVSLILDPSCKLGDLLCRCDDLARANAGRKPDLFERVHGESSEPRAEHLILQQFIPALAAPSMVEGIGASPLSQVLLTGANGFFGGAIALELLEALPAAGRVFCLVRGVDDAQAAARFRAAFATDSTLLARIDQALYAQRLRVLAGDVSQPALGLAADDYRRLGHEVDHVIHNGALVNHTFTYRALFEPNVKGTAEVIAFALASRSKRVCYVSSIALADSLLPRDAGLREAGDLSPLRSRGPTTGYAAGYAATKWASEILLQQASEQYGLPVVVMRPSWLLAHRRHLGQINGGDLLCRFLFGLVTTGMAPSQDGGAEPCTFASGLPVDYAASALVGWLAAAEPTEAAYQVCHLVSSMAHRTSLSDLVGWVGAAGYSLDTVTPVHTWHQRFTAALRGLRASERRHSPLALLDDWPTAKALLFAGQNYPSIASSSRLRRIMAQRGAAMPEAIGCDELVIKKSLAGMVLRGILPHRNAVASPTHGY